MWHGSWSSGGVKQLWTDSFRTVSSDLGLYKYHSPLKVRRTDLWHRSNMWSASFLVRKTTDFQNVWLRLPETKDVVFFLAGMMMFMRYTLDLCKNTQNTTINAHLNAHITPSNLISKVFQFVISLVTVSPSPSSPSTPETLISESVRSLSPPQPISSNNIIIMRCFLDRFINLISFMLLLFQLNTDGNRDKLFPKTALVFRSLQRRLLESDSLVQRQLLQDVFLFFSQQRLAAPTPTPPRFSSSKSWAEGGWMVRACGLLSRCYVLLFITAFAGRGAGLWGEKSSPRGERRSQSPLILYRNLWGIRQCY